MTQDSSDGFETPSKSKMISGMYVLCNRNQERLKEKNI